MLGRTDLHAIEDDVGVEVVGKIRHNLVMKSGDSRLSRRRRLDPAPTVHSSRVSAGDAALLGQQCSVLGQRRGPAGAPADSASSQSLERRPPSIQPAPARGETFMGQEAQSRALLRTPGMEEFIFGSGNEESVRRGHGVLLSCVRARPNIRSTCGKIPGVGVSVLPFLVRAPC